tara:strand:+ start:313 stop:576 length:264 start_codon:yes stop_codon:yes gene_type:complete
MNRTKNLMRVYAYGVIAELGVCQKNQIKDKLYDKWKQYESISKQFVMLFADLGWMFQDLKEQGVIVSNGRRSSAARWKITTQSWEGK